MIERLEKLKQAECEFPVESIMIDGQCFWPFFRLLIFSHQHVDVIQIHRKDRLTPILKLRNALFGFTLWLKRWDYIFFSNEQERKKIDGQFFDKLTDHAIETLGPDASLYVEHVERSHLPRAAYGSKSTASFDFVLVLAGLLKPFNRSLKNIEIKNESVLTAVLSQLGITIDYRTKLQEFLVKVKVLQTLFRIAKPKIVFITDYGNMSTTYAANVCGIKTVEFQHGVIGMVHPYYHPSKKLSKNFCPNFLFAFGMHDLISLSHGNYVDKNCVLPVGNFFLDKVRKLPLRQDILDRIEGFKKSVCVPTDRITHNYLIQFITEIAYEMPDVIFIVVPRSTSFLKDADKTLPSNLQIDTKHSFQEIVRHCSVNSCTNSTCCLEALTLGIPNILIDEDGQSSLYYGDILSDRKTTKFAKSKAEYKRLLREHEPISEHLTMESNQRNFIPNYQEQFNAAMNLIKL